VAAFLGILPAAASTLPPERNLLREALLRCAETGYNSWEKSLGGLG